MLLSACGGEPPPQGGCTEGLSVSCACPDGRTGAQVCRADRTFSGCLCLGGDGGMDGPLPPLDVSIDTLADAADAPLGDDRDAGEDSPPDALLDAAGEVVADAPADGPDADAALDAPADAAPDAPLDAPDDAPLDAPADRAEAPLDAPPDALPDAPPDALPDAAPDAPLDVSLPTDPCAPGALIDLNAAGAVAGITTTYLASNAAAPDTAPLVPTQCMLATPVRRLRAFRYVTRTRSRLRVSTEASATTFDTVAWALDRCAPTGATPLGCDDNGFIPRSLFVTATLPAGTTVFVLVGGVDGASGNFSLAVSELPLVATGGACDTARRANACAEGDSCRGSSGAAQCLTDLPSGAPCVSGSGPACAAGTVCSPSCRGSFCRPEGVLNGPCRATTGAGTCDPGLACSGNACRTAVALGARCDGLTNACPLGSTCNSVDFSSRCLADGERGGRCRTGAGVTPCDAGLACASPADRCVRMVASGGACDGSTARCAVAGEECVRSGTESLCVRPGAFRGRCASSGTACDAGLVCGPDRLCVRGVAVGAACDPSGATDTCLNDSFGRSSSCITNGSTSTCVVRGGLGGACTPGCSGLACNGDGFDPASRCRYVVSAGGACDLAGVANACSSGFACLPGTPGPTCVRSAALGGRCSAQYCDFTTCSFNPAPCDDGLSACNGDPTSPASRCRTRLADGAVCDPTGATNACIAPAACLTVGGASTCRRVRYEETALPSPTFIEACDGDGVRVAMTTTTPIGRATTPLTIPFPFTFYGARHTLLWPSQSGYARLGSLPPDGTIPLPTRAGDLIAPFMQPLSAADACSAVCARTVGTAPARRFAVEWFAVGTSVSSEVRVTFELVLNESDGSIDFLYQRLEPATGAAAVYADGTRASIGVQSYNGLLSQVHAGTVSTATGVRLTPR